MTKFSRFLLVLTVLLTSSIARSGEETFFIPKNVTLKGIERGTFNTSAVKANDLTVISFFASWCSKCGKTMFDLNKISSQFEDVNWIALSVDEDMHSAKDFFKHLPKKYSHLKQKSYLDKNVKIAESIEVEAVPAYVIVDNKGKVIFSGKGHPDAAQLKLIKSVIAKQSDLAH